MIDSLNALMATILFGQDEVFTHEDGDTTPPTIRHFNATQIRAYLTRVNAPVLTFQFDERLYEHLVRKQGVEERKVTRLMERPDIYAQPVLVAFFGDKHLIIDGSHRLVIQWRMGLREFKGYPVPQEIWERFLVDLPTDDPEFTDYALGRNQGNGN